MTNIAIENGPVEIVDLPIKKIVDLSSSLWKRLPEGRPGDTIAMGISGS